MMATTQELAELEQYIRRVLPDQKFLTGMKPNEAAGIMEFTWHARHFAVTLTLDVFELKGQSLLLTGASMLMQAALRTKERNNKVLGTVVETMRTAEENMRGVNLERGLALLGDAKKTLLRLAGK